MKLSSQLLKTETGWKSRVSNKLAKTSVFVQERTSHNFGWSFFLKYKATSRPLIQLTPAQFPVLDNINRCDRKFFRGRHRDAVRLMTASIRLMGQSKFVRSIIDATQPEQRHGSA